MALHMVRGFSPSPPLKSPREVKPVEKEAVDNKEGVTASDTVHFLTEALKDAKMDSKRETEQKMQKVMNNEEIHKAKVTALWWGAIPFIGAMVGLLNTALTNPEKKAENRADVKANFRTKQSGIEQEQKIKGVKLKATLVTAFPQLLGLGIAGIAALLDKEIRECLFSKNMGVFQKLSGLYLGFVDIKSFQEGLFQKNPFAFWASVLVGATSILAPLGYTLFEKSHSEDFNKGL
jgi:hypothetical protein